MRFVSIGSWPQSFAAHLLIRFWCKSCTKQSHLYRCIFIQFCLLIPSTGLKAHLQMYWYCSILLDQQAVLEVCLNVTKNRFPYRIPIIGFILWYVKKKNSDGSVMKMYRGSYIYFCSCFCCGKEDLDFVLFSSGTAWYNCSHLKGNSSVFFSAFFRIKKEK